MARRPKRYAPTARRKLIWARSLDLMQPPAAIPAAGTAVDLLAQFRADGGSSLGSTIAWIRCDYTMIFTNPATPNLTSQDQLALGIIVDQRQANQLEVPRPGVEEHADWMYWRRRSLFATNGTMVPGSQATSVSYVATDVIDVKSSRKLEELDQTLWFVADPSYSTGTPIVAMNVNCSVLLMLP